MNDEELVKNTLIDFFKEMNLWEKESFSLLEQKNGNVEHIKETFNTAKISLELIYNKFLTKKKRVFTTRYNSLKCPPEYDHFIETIKDIAIKNSKRIELETVKNGVTGQRNQYVFLKEDGQWKIDNKKTYWNHKNKYESTTI
jgi:hypothetical protein